MAAVTALVYAAVGWLALLLAVPPGYASPLYPSAGIALAAVLVYGRTALPGVLVGAFLVNLLLGASRGQSGGALLWLPLCIGIGAALQAAAGAALIRRFVRQPLVLVVPRDIVLCGLLATLSCTVNPTLATLSLAAGGVVIDAAHMAGTWGTWWLGDALGVLIGAPLALTLIGQPRADWAQRRRTVGMPLLLSMLLLGAGSSVIGDWDAERTLAAFSRDADRITGDAEARLRQPLHALQAVHSAHLAAGGLDARQLEEASRWWLAQPLHLQATGMSQRVPRGAVPAFEAAAQADGLPGYRVFDRGGAALPAEDVVAIRQIAPRAANAAALGSNAMSVAVTRMAVERARDSGAPAASGPFRVLTQPGVEETAFVLSQAVYDGAPANLQQRRAAFRGVVFVTVRADRLLDGLGTGGSQPLRWCLIDGDPAASQRRLAGPVGCETIDPGGTSVGDKVFERSRSFLFAQRSIELHVRAPPAALRTAGPANARLFSLFGLLAAAMLGALLLEVTGRARRIQLAVQERTAELQLEVQEHARAQDALRDSEDRLRSILDNVPIGVVFLDTTGRILETNPRLCEMLGRPAPLLLQSTLAEISHPDEQVDNRKLLQELLHGNSTRRQRRMRLLRADGKALWVQAHFTALRDAHGQPQRLAGVVEDITEHLRLEESERALDIAEAASRAKSEFVSRMSHELRTPLNAMIGFSQLLGLDRQPALAQHQHAWAVQIQRAGWHLLEMINDTLDLARIESGAVQLALRPVAVDAMVAASIAMVFNSARLRAVSVREELAPEAAAVLGDETRLKQVLTNLLTNAVKYNRDGGSVVVASALGPDGSVDISVRDTGLGMTPEQMSALFQPYNRLGREGGPIEGTGIGLVISRRLAELMGGTLAAASVAGQGSVFTLRLPRAPAAVPDATASQQGGPAPYQRRLVHYVEDNEVNVEVMRGILAQRPQIALDVSTMGLDGLAAIRARRPDLILLDMHLPDISGLELLRHMKQDDDVADIPVIVVSADATTARMQEALTLGAVHYVTKPVDIGSFLATLDATLEAMETRWGAYGV